MSSPSRHVHCAALQLGAPFACGPDELRARLAEFERLALTRLVELCLSEQARALVVDGPALDALRLLPADEAFARAQFARLAAAGVAVVSADAAVTRLSPGAVVTAAGAEPVLRDERGRIQPKLPEVTLAPPRLLGRGFHEPGAHGALLVDGSGRQAEAGLRALAPLRWETLQARAPERAEELAADLGAQLARLDHVLPGQHWMLRVRLAGPITAPRDAEALLDLSDECGRALADRGVLSCEVLDGGLHAPIDLAGRREREDRLGLLLQLIDEAGLDLDALPLPAPAAFAGSPDGERLARLLADLPGPAAELLSLEPNA